MEQEFPGPESPLFRAMMTGLFAGIMATVLCLAFNVVYRDSGGFFSSVLINVSSIIFGVNILFVLIGLLYGACLKGAGKGEAIFEVIFIALTIIGCVVATRVHRSDDVYMNGRFHGLLLGMVLISGISAILMPVMYHSKKFRDAVV